MMSAKRTLAAVVLAAIVAAPSTAVADITDARATPTALARAAAIDESTVTSAAYTAIAPTNVPAGLSDVPLATFPRSGSTYAILSTGDARFADDANLQDNLSADLNYTAPVA